MSKYSILENLAVSDSGFLFLTTTGETFTLNEQGREIFKLLQQKYTQEEISDKLLEEYDIDKSTFSRDFEDFFAQLKNYGLIKEV